MSTATNALFSVRVPRSAEDSEYLVVAASAEAAAGLYVAAVMADGAEAISVEPEEMAEAGELYVDKIGEAAEGEPRILDWGSVETITRQLKPIEKETVSLAGFEAWAAWLEDEGIEP
ncbi:hypothetical protein [Defluviimonas salinarum]|uniref:Uncharacterized protein n=1 Tax=Defluviimonas salinarum TaxID=2992147 RepID=A0ABT3J9P5_9RHOB|nr:hypothetical protein [Defluviimonas salinarum]MCW3784180.1 hypothetical protein [Defluviimonas salinarum]